MDKKDWVAKRLKFTTSRIQTNKDKAIADSLVCLSGCDRFSKVNEIKKDYERLKKVNEIVMLVSLLKEVSNTWDQLFLRQFDLSPEITKILSELSYFNDFNSLSLQEKSSIIEEFVNGQ